MPEAPDNVVSLEDKRYKDHIVEIAPHFFARTYNRFLVSSVLYEKLKGQHGRDHANVFVLEGCYYSSSWVMMFNGEEWLVLTPRRRLDVFDLVFQTRATVIRVLDGLFGKGKLIPDFTRDLHAAQPIYGE